MKEIKINEKQYHIKMDYKNAFDIEAVTEKITDYFDKYDYIVGDWAYGKLRLKGFCKKSNAIFNEINNFETIDLYLKKHCAYDCKYFILEKLKNM